jgi:O-antigen ligase
MEGALSTNPGLRTLSIAVPGLLIAVFLGMLLGEGSVMTGVIVLAGSVAFLSALALARRGRLEVAMVAFLIVGYFVGNRGFAQLSLAGPLFVGEVGLAITAALLAGRAVIARDIPDFKNPLIALVGIYLLYAVARFSFDVRQYRIDSIRDLAVVYYAAFFFIAYQLGCRTGARAFLEKWILVAVVLHAAVALIFQVYPHILQTSFAIRGAPLLLQKGDLTATFTAASIFIVANRPRIFGQRWLRTAVLLVLIACLALSAARAAILGAMVASLLLWLAGKRELFLYGAGAAVALAILILAVNVFSGSLHDSEHAMVFKEKMASMTDFKGERRYQTDFGVNKANNNQFRTTFWKVMMDDTTKANPVFGRGFGYNFLPKFEAYYNRGGWEGLRSPHNYYITVYGRMGVVGSVIFLLITFLMVREAIRAAALVRRKQLSPADFSYWCAAVVLLVSATFGVVLEGPMGGIPFWTFLGLALSGMVLQRRAAREAEPEPERAMPMRPRFQRPPARKLVHAS